MRRDWLLVETLGPRLTLVAQGRQLRKCVSLTSFLNRNPFATEIWAAVAATHRSGRGSVVSSASGDRLIHTAPVTMTDQRVHGVQVWCGPCSTQPPDRPLIGAVVWDLTTGIATNTPEALLNSGFDYGTEPTHGRAFAEDLAPGELHADEGKSLAQIIKCQPGERFCSTTTPAPQRRDYIGARLARAIGFDRNHIGKSLQYIWHIIDTLNDYLRATQAGQRTFTDTAHDLLPYYPA